MKIYQLIDFTKNHTDLNEVNIQPTFENEGYTPFFTGTVVELLESQYEFLELPVVNAIYDRKNAVLNIFYDPDKL